MQVSRPNRRSREGCWTCRKRKKKCDSTEFPCGNCSRLNLECKRDVRLVWEDDARRDGMKRRGPPKPATKGDDSTVVETGRTFREEAIFKDASTPGQVIFKINPEPTTITNVKPSTPRSLSNWPFDLDETESMLLNHYVQRFSRTYPTFSGPTNPFLRVFLPLSMQSRVVLDALLALGGVQSWHNGNFTLEKAMLTLRHKALRGCRELVANLGLAAGPNQIEDGQSSPKQLQLSIQSTLNGGQNTEGTQFLHLLTSCVLLLLYEKLGGADQQNGTSHLQFFAQLLPRPLLKQTMARADEENVSENTTARAFQFVSSLFLYNDLVRSTSLQTSTLSDFYLDQAGSANSCGEESGGPNKTTCRFTFPQLIARIAAHDSTVTDADIAGWDGNLGWLPSFALVSVEGKPDDERTPTADRAYIMDPRFRRLDSFASPSLWSEERIISDLYRIAAIVFRRQNLVNPSGGSVSAPLSEVDLGELSCGNLPLWGAQLIEQLQPGSRFENTLLWPIGIIAKELVRIHLPERNMILSKLGALEGRFQMKHFARVAKHLQNVWAMSDQGLVYEGGEELLFG